MPEIIEIMAPPTDQVAYFTVDNTQQFVNPVYPGGANFILENADRATQFSPGDSFQVLSAGLILPESFTWCKTPEPNVIQPLPGIVFQPKGATTGHDFLNTGFQNGKLYLPMENYETILGIFCNTKDYIDVSDPTKTLNDEPFKLLCYHSILYPISMKGVPDEFNGKIYYIVPFLKILHNSPLSH